MKTSREWLTPQEVGNMAGGFTAEFVRREIKAGELAAEWCLSQRGKLGRWRIRRSVADAYVSRLHGLSSPTTPTSLNT